MDAGSGKYGQNAFIAANVDIRQQHINTDNAQREKTLLLYWYLALSYFVTVMTSFKPLQRHFQDVLEALTLLL